MTISSHNCKHCGHYSRPGSKECATCVALLFKYGITRKEREQMLHDQMYLCKICDTELDGFSSPKYGSVMGRGVVDHKKGTKEVRGILCNQCNTALGLFKDDPNRLARAILYLEDHNAY